MRFIEGLRDYYEKAKRFWIVGTGPSIDDLPLDFFDSKISIAARPCGVIFPNCTYNFCSYDDLWAPRLKKTPHLLKKQIFTLNPKHKKNWLGKYNDWPIFMRTLKWYSFGYTKKRGVDRKYIEHTVKEIMEKRSTHYTSMGLIQGWMIEAAAVMGAKEIILCGCEGKATRNKYHAQRLNFFYKPGLIRKGLWLSEGNFSPEQLKIAERFCASYRTETRWLAEIFKPYGVKIRRYRYKEGYEEIT